MDEFGYKGSEGSLGMWHALKSHLKQNLSVKSQILTLPLLSVQTEHFLGHTWMNSSAVLLMQKSDLSISFRSLKN